MVAWLLLNCENFVSCESLSLVVCALMLDKLGCLCASLVDKLGAMSTKTNKGRMPTKVSFQLHLLFFVLR